MDGVLTESPAPLARAANAHFGIDLPESAFVDSSGLNVSMDIREWVYSPHGPAASLAPADGAQHFLATLERLVGDGNVMVITARPETSAAMTLDWFKAHGFVQCPVIFADDKSSIARRQGCAYAVEDSIRHATNYAADGFTCFLINHAEAIDTDASGKIIPVTSFDQIVQVVERLVSAPMLPPGVSALPPASEATGETSPLIVVSDAIHPVAREAFERVGRIVDVDGTKVPALLEAIRDADALVVRSETQVTEEVLAAAPMLKVIARAGVGIDNIDVDAATRHGVLVLNAPGANATSAGEHTISLLLAIARQLPYANQTTHSGEWKRKAIKPFDLRGRTVGIVGLGRVGTIVAKRLKAFEMRVIASDPYIPDDRFDDAGVERAEFDDLLGQADIVTFHCPSTGETAHMLDRESLSRMKRGAIVLNCARGDIVDQEALAEAIRSGHIAAAGIDVFPHEPCTESPLFGLDNVVLTPHTGGSSAEALEAVGRVIGTTTIAALRGESVPNAVNLPPASLEAPALRMLTSVAAAAGHLLSVLMPEQPASVSIEARGLVSNDILTHVMNAALANALQRWLGRRVTSVNARMIAGELGIAIRESADDGDETSIPQFRFTVRGDTTHSVVISWDRAVAGIVEVDRFSLAQPLAGYVLITHHHDQPGVIGKLATVLARYNINIAGMQVSRHEPRAEAMMVTNVDEDIPPDALDEIRAVDAVEDAFIVSLPNMPVEPDAMQVAMMTTAAHGSR